MKHQNINENDDTNNYVEQCHEILSEITTVTGQENSEILTRFNFFKFHFGHKFFADVQIKMILNKLKMKIQMMLNFFTRYQQHVYTCKTMKILMTVTRNFLLTMKLIVVCTCAVIIRNCQGLQIVKS